MKIYFKKSNPFGSAINRADQISAYLAGIGYESASLYDVSSIRDSIIVFVKFREMADVVDAKKRGNTVIYDCVDALATGEQDLAPEEADLFDGIIFPVKSLLAKYEDRLRNTFCSIIYHHYDPKIVTPEWPHSHFRLGYIGSIEGLMHGGEIDELEAVTDFAQQPHMAPFFSCHYSVRPEDSKEFRFKPNSKLSTAAACRSNIILTREDVHLELLGSDYPYFTSSEIGDVRRAVRNAKESFGGPEWKRGLEYMEMVRFRTNIRSIINGFLYGTKIIRYI